MPSRKALSEIERKPRLKKAWIGYLEKKGLDRAYEIGMACNDVAFYDVQFIARMTANERKRYSAVRNNFIKSYMACKDIADTKLMKKYEVGPKDATEMINADKKILKEWKELIYGHANLVRTMKDGKQAVLVDLNMLAETTHASGFKASNQYASFLTGDIDPRKVGKAMDLLDFETDQILAMSVAVATDNTAQINRVSQQIADNHKPKKGKKLTAKDVKTSMAKVIKKMKFL